MEEKERPVVIISGGFDPPHIGHMRLIHAAARLGRVLALVHSDGWLQRKKGHVFMPLAERCEFLLAVEGVWGVRMARDQDNEGVEESLRAVRDDYPDDTLIFANGGDRLQAPEAEERVCREEGIVLAYNVGGGKVQSSSALVKAVQCGSG